MSLNHNILSKIESKMASDVYLFTRTIDDEKECGGCYETRIITGEIYIRPKDNEELVDILIDKLSKSYYKGMVMHEIVRDMYKDIDKIPENISFEDIKNYLLRIKDLCHYISSIYIITNILDNKSYKYYDSYYDDDIKLVTNFYLHKIEPKKIVKPLEITDNIFYRYNTNDSFVSNLSLSGGYLSCYKMSVEDRREYI